jgi:hypothetical protein
VNQYLQQLAIKHSHIKFLKIISTETSSTWDDITLPSLLVYKDGELFKTLIRIQETLGHTFDVDNLEQYLIR